jgi:hypothetical protein
MTLAFNIKILTFDVSIYRSLRYNRQLANLQRGKFFELRIESFVKNAFFSPVSLFLSFFTFCKIFFQTVEWQILKSYSQVIRLMSSDLHSWMSSNSWPALENDELGWRLVLEDRWRGGNFECFVRILGFIWEKSKEGRNFIIINWQKYTVIDRQFYEAKFIPVGWL